VRRGLGIGLLCPVVAALSVPHLRRLDEEVGVRDLDLALLQQVPMLRALPLPSIEQLARGLEPVAVAPQETVFSQGDVGDRYYVIESGEVEVVGDGAVVATLGPGEGFGEIALLRRTPRTATVVARTEARMQTLTSERFLPVILGYTPSAREASAVVEVMLVRYSPPSLGERDESS
jgi:CRP-like cAMP-binding protein